MASRATRAGARCGGLAIVALTLVAAVAACGARPVAGPRAPTLQAHLEEVADWAVKTYAAKGLRPEGIALAAVRLGADGAAEWAHVRGDQAVYPASLVKLFYLVALHGYLDDGRLVESAELARATTDMIVDSANDPTGYLLDVLTGASGGAELPADELAVWMAQRQAVNRYFQALGFTGVNACQKTWAEGPYGRERQGYGPQFELRNSASAKAIAKLWIEHIVRARGPRAEVRRALLARDFTVASADPEDQRSKFTGAALPAGAKLWSKAGWTSTVRHDSAYVELPTGEKLVWVILTQGVADETALIPAVSRRFLAWFGPAS